MARYNLQLKVQVHAWIGDGDGDWEVEGGGETVVYRPTGTLFFSNSEFYHFFF